MQLPTDKSFQLLSKYNGGTPEGVPECGIGGEARSLNP